MTLFEEDVVLSSCSGAVGRIFLNRAHYQNSINADLLRSLATEVRRLNEKDELRVLVLQSSVPEVFSVGLDVRSIVSLGSGAMREFLEQCHEMVRLLTSIRIPTIAAVDGYALGAGLELAMLCDLTVVTEASQFGQPESSFGMLPCFGALGLLEKRVSAGVMKRLLFAGEIVGAEDALKWGMVDQVVNRGDLSSSVQALAHEISNRSPVAAHHLKRNFHLSEIKPGIEEIMEVFESEDRQSGMQGFLRKEVPVFTGK